MAQKINLIFIGTLVAIVAISCSLLTISRNKVWFSGETLWLDTIKVSPQNVTSYRNLGSIYLARNEFQKALYYFRFIAESDPIYYYTLGIEAYRLGNLEEAREHFSKALARNINDINTLFYLGVVQENLKNYESASEMFRAVLRSRTLDTERFKERAQEHLSQIYGSR